MLTMFRYQGNTNQNYTEIPSLPGQKDCQEEGREEQVLLRIQRGEDPVSTICGTAFGCYGNQYSSNVRSIPPLTYFQRDVN